MKILIETDNFPDTGDSRDIFLELADRLDAGDPPPTATLVEYLSHSETAIRKLAIELLEYSNDTDAIPALFVATDDPDIEVAIAAGAVIRAFRNPAANSAIIASLNSLSSQIRLTAIIALRERKAVQAIEPLLFLLGDKDPEIRREVITTLAYFRRDDLILAIRSTLHDSDASVRRVAVEVLVDSNSTVIFDDLVIALDDSDWRVRKAAVSGLGRFYGESGANALRSSLDDPAWQVVKEALHSLGRINARADRRVLKLLNHELADVRIAAATAIGQSNEPEVIPWLGAATNDPDTGVQKAAVFAIARLSAIKNETNTL